MDIDQRSMDYTYSYRKFAKIRNEREEQSRENFSISVYMFNGSLIHQNKPTRP